MRRWIKVAGIAALGVAILGATNPPESATVTMSKGYDKGSGLGTATMQQYFLLPNGATCRGKQRLALLGWMTGKSVAKPVPAGTSIDIFAVIERVNAFHDGVCQNNVTFTPIPGHSYTVIQRTAVWDSCKIEVTDIATNQTPADLKQDNSVECVKTEKSGKSE
jgi:hypothetical protein